MLKSSFLKKSLLVLGVPVWASAAVTYFNPADTATVPKTLGALGIYTNIAAMPISAKKLDTNIFHFEVNSALWSDDAHKTRWVMLKNRNRLPAGSGSIKYDEKSDFWAYPDSTIFIKQFAIDTVGTDTLHRVLWETRILINKKEAVDDKGTMSDRWYGFSYKWRKDQLDADLVDMSHGKDDSIRTWPTGTGAGKVPYMKKWHFPNIYQCEACHKVNTAESDSVHGRSVLGFFTAQLNRPHPDVANTNQLEYFFTKKLLTGTKSDWNAATTPRWHGVNDSNFTASTPWENLNQRARAYIAANCSGCHGRRGIEVGAAMGVDLNYDFHTMESKMEFRNRVLSWAWTLDEVAPFYYPKDDPANSTHGDSVPIVPALVVPGYPEKSIILFRQKSRNTEPNNFDAVRNQMPPLATFEVNAAAADLMARWIKGMPALPVGPDGNVLGLAHHGQRSQLKGPVIRSGLVILSAELLAANKGAVKLTGIDGRTMELKRLSATTFALPAGLPKGVYILRVGKQSFTRYLF